MQVSWREQSIDGEMTGYHPSQRRKVFHKRVNTPGGSWITVYETPAGAASWTVSEEEDTEDEENEENEETELSEEDSGGLPGGEGFCPGGASEEFWSVLLGTQSHSLLHS